MRLPILVAARPGVSRGSGVVPLGEGKWHVVTMRVTDTILTMRVNNVPLPAPLSAMSDGHIVQGPCEVAIEFARRGTEDYIHVFADLVK